MGQMRQKYGLSGYMHGWEHGTMNSKQAREQILIFSEIENSDLFIEETINIFSRGSRLLKKILPSRHKLQKCRYKIF